MYWRIGMVDKFLGILDSEIICTGPGAKMMPTNRRALSAAIRNFEEEFPGWWWTISNYGLTRCASCGPDANGPDADLLKLPEFLYGFHCEAEDTAAAVLRDVHWQAFRVKSAARRKEFEEQHPEIVKAIADLLAR